MKKLRFKINFGVLWSFIATIAASGLAVQIAPEPYKPYVTVAGLIILGFHPSPLMKLTPLVVGQEIVTALGYAEPLLPTKYQPLIEDLEQNWPLVKKSVGVLNNASDPAHLAMCRSRWLKPSADG